MCIVAKSAVRMLADGQMLPSIIVAAMFQIGTRDSQTRYICRRFAAVSVALQTTDVLSSTAKADASACKRCIALTYQEA